MITEDYVSFETAKLLKEKGFDELTYACFSSDGKETYYGYRAVGDDINCPTLQMAMKWLRNEKGIAIIPVLHSVLDNERFLFDVKIVVAKTNDKYIRKWFYEKPEEACEDAIRYCLENLI